MITRIALVHPEIAFKFTNADKTIIQTSGDGNIKNVIYSIYGKTIAQACLNVNYEFEGITITGVVGKPEIARSNRTNQMFFVNQRYIRDRILSNAAEKAFKGMIPIGKFGFLVLNLEMAPSMVDVNVHPAKLEVRFQEEQKVFKAVYCGIQDTLLKAELIANSETQITGKIEKGSMNVEKLEDTEGAKSSLSGLFRRIARNAPEEKETENNVIESIYNSKNSKENDNKAQGTENVDVQSPVNNEQKQSTEDIINQVKSQIDAINREMNKEGTTKVSDYKINPVYTNTTSEEVINKANDTSSNITSSVNTTANVTGNDAIKKTIDELMQMGAGLTPEQIREKLSKIAENSTASSNAVSNVSNLQTSESILNNTQKENEEIKEYNKEELNKENVEENATQDTLQENDKTEDTQTINLRAIERIVKNKENIEEKEEDTSILQEGQKPGDILLNIIQEQNEKYVGNEVKESPKQFDDMYEQIFGNMTASAKEKEKNEEKKSSANDIVNSNMNMFEEEETIPYRFIGIAFRTYIILEIEDELYILDQHAAHERIMYEKVKKNYYSDEEKDSQIMLLPDVITLTHKEMDIARENMDKFEKAGFVLEEFGDNTIKLTGVPNICLDLDTKNLFLETLDEINTVARTAKQEIEERFIATIACKAAVKANMALNEEEVESLLDELLKLPNPFTCPHGRPTAIKLSKTDIEKKFARRK